MRQALTRILESAGFKVLAAGDLEEAVRLVKRTAPDLFMTNVYVPQSTGRDAAALLKKLCPGTRTLMVAGLPEEEPIMKGVVGSDVMDFFPKPFTASELTPRCVNSSALGMMAQAENPKGAPRTEISNPATRSMALTDFLILP
jgi:DNA-binding response OmpR family regulator